MSSSVTAREGQEYQLNCVSSNGGNPEPNITWYRNNQLLTSSQGFKIQQTQHLNGSTSSLLSLIPTLEDHQAVYKCLVMNRAMSVPHEVGHRLQVECKYSSHFLVRELSSNERMWKGIVIEKENFRCQIFCPVELNSIYLLANLAWETFPPRP